VALQKHGSGLRKFFRLRAVKNRGGVSHRRCGHDGLRRLRQKVYAHTSEASGRTASMKIESAGEVFTLSWREQWLPIPREDLPAAISLSEQQRDLFRNDAAAIEVELRGLGT
jgi:hypothetical protein